MIDFAGADISEIARFSLQIGTFKVQTPQPKPSPITEDQCPMDSSISNNCTCPGGEQALCAKGTAGTSCILGPPYCNTGSFQTHCEKNENTDKCNKEFEEGKCQGWCFGKPVIYLYPSASIQVDVRLDTPGDIYISDPVYPKVGWQSILAFPDGHLLYRGKSYPYLYYEFSVDNKPPRPTEGILIKKEDLKTQLFEITAKLGLIPTEQREFLDYWLPKLNSLSSRYVIFSLLTTSQKEAIDHVDISPTPSTRIEFLVNFIPTDDPTLPAPLVFPPIYPRAGFTMVEWGGTIARY